MNEIYEEVANVNREASLTESLWTTEQLDNKKRTQKSIVGNNKENIGRDQKRCPDRRELNGLVVDSRKGQTRRKMTDRKNKVVHEQTAHVIRIGEHLTEYLWTAEGVR